MSAILDELIDAAIAGAAGIQVERQAFKAHLIQAKAASDANVPDLLIAFASLRGDRAASKELEQRLYAVSRGVLARYGDQSFAEEVLQEVREKLLVGPGAKLRGYSGRGALVQFLKTVVTTSAIDRSRQEKARNTDDPGEDDERLEKLASSERSADSQLFSARSKSQFSRAFKEALAALTAQERTLLRMKFVDGVSIEEIGRAFQVHRTTAMRWIEKLQTELLHSTRERLKAQLNVKDHELEGVMKEMELSISERLSQILPALKR